MEIYNFIHPNGIYGLLWKPIFVQGIYKYKLVNSSLVDVYNFIHPKGIYELLWKPIFVHGIYKYKLVNSSLVDVYNFIHPNGIYGLLWKPIFIQIQTSKFLSLRVFGLLSLSLLSFPLRFGCGPL